MNPHDIWAIYYEFVYEKTYGPAYGQFSSLTNSAISGILSNGSVIDYGAGTGRLSIPLAEQGYNVIAIEKSTAMVEEFKRKCAQRNLTIPVYNCSIVEYENGKADLALARFTVLNYSITEEEMAQNFKTISEHLNPNGYFFFDLPDPIFFRNEQLFNINQLDFRRSVKLINTGKNNIYTYQEICNGTYEGTPFNYTDEFQIRYWDKNLIDGMLRENGFADTLRAFPQFSSTGSTYKLYRKL